MYKTIIISLILITDPTVIQDKNTRERGPHLKTKEGRELCYLMRDWKNIMKRDYPKKDRSIPSMAYHCDMKDD